MKKQKAFCCFCGKEVIRKDIEDKLRDFCPHCKTIFYENPLPVASSIVVNENREVLLVRRKKDPYMGMWCLPIGFAESGEEVREAALRELKEEAGIEGQIMRLIDVDTVENYFYGSLAIVTYEVKCTGGEVRPGDDATDAGFFPIMSIPELAWTSNEKAIRIYIDLYKDIWAMVDSFKNLFPELGSINEITPKEKEQKLFLSNILIKLIDKNMNKISEDWLEDIKKAVPGAVPHLEVLVTLNKNILRGIQFWLSRGKGTLGIEEFIESGENLGKLGVKLTDIQTALALSRKALWKHLVKERIIFSPLEMYTTLEMNNRIIFFFDRINYYLTRGYFGE